MQNLMSVSCSEMCALEGGLSKFNFPALVPQKIDWTPVDRGRSSGVCSCKLHKEPSEIQLPGKLRTWYPAENCMAGSAERLQMRSYRLQLLQALKNTDLGLQAPFCADLGPMEEDGFPEKLGFSDEATFHISTKAGEIEL